MGTWATICNSWLCDSWFSSSGLSPVCTGAMSGLWFLHKNCFKMTIIIKKKKTRRKNRLANQCHCYTEKYIIKCTERDLTDMTLPKKSCFLNLLRKSEKILQAAIFQKWETVTHDSQLPLLLLLSLHKHVFFLWYIDF